MARGLLDAVGLFCLPFIVYALFLVARSRFPGRADAWSRGPLAALVASGLALAVAGTLVLGLLSPVHRGAYVPAHIEKGQLVPGRIE